jgi:hypothetical protein
VANAYGLTETMPSHARFGLSPGAFVVAAEAVDAEAPAATLDAHCTEHLERWKRPRLYAKPTRSPARRPSAPRAWRT